MMHMEPLTKVEVFQELYQLIDYYSEHRDHPADPDFDFFKNVKYYCDQLDLNYQEFIRTFGLKQL